jgi:hypothetical protein
MGREIESTGRSFRLTEFSSLSLHKDLKLLHELEEEE